MHADADSWQAWCGAWLPPIAQALCSDSRQLRAGAALYAVPAVLDVQPHSLAVLLTELLDSRRSLHKVGALMGGFRWFCPFCFCDNSIRRLESAGGASVRSVYSLCTAS